MQTENRQYFLIFCADAYGLRLLDRLIELTPSLVPILVGDYLSSSSSKFICIKLAEVAEFAKKNCGDILIGLAVHFMEYIPAEVRSIPLFGCYNLHPGELPQYRGNWPESWAILEGRDPQVTLHAVEEKIDEGPIVASTEIKLLPEDTGQTIADKLEDAGIELVSNWWPRLLVGDIPRRDQAQHFPARRTQDLMKLAELDLDRSVKTGDLLLLLRAMSMPGWNIGCYFHSPDNGDRITVHVSLSRG